MPGEVGCDAAMTGDWQPSPEETRRIEESIEHTRMNYKKWIGTCPKCGAPDGNYCTDPTPVRVGLRVGRIIRTVPHDERPTERTECGGDEHVSPHRGCIMR